MKIIIAILMTICLPWMPELAMAADGEGEGVPPPPRPQDSGFKLPPPVARFLDKVKEDNPSKYEHLQKMYKDDPRSFHREMRQILRSERRKYFGRSGNRFGKGSAAQKPVPPFSPRGGDRDFREWGRSGKPPRIDILKSEIADLAKEYRQERVDAGRKKKLGKEIKTKLAEVYELREEKWRQMVNEMEDKLQRMKERIQERRSNRTEILDRQFHRVVGEKR